MTAQGTYQQGHLDGVLTSGWTCGDCGNTYDSGVQSCPNLILDLAYIKQRSVNTSELASDDHEDAQESGDSAQFGYIAQGRTADGRVIVVGPFATRDAASQAAGGQPVVRMELSLDHAGEHSPECPNYYGSCCPWMGDCTCQCLCELISSVEARVRTQASGTQ